MGKWNLFENIKMAVIRNNVGRIGGKGAIDKLVIVMICSNKAQMELRVNKLNELAFDNGVDYVVRTILLFCILVWRAKVLFQYGFVLLFAPLTSIP